MVTEKDEIEFRIDEHEIAAATVYYQIVLRILKDKGAPIDGIVWLSPRPGYRIRREDLPEDLGRCSMRYVFTKEKSDEKENTARMD